MSTHTCRYLGLALIYIQFDLILCMKQLRKGLPCMVLCTRKRTLEPIVNILHSSFLQTSWLVPLYKLFCSKFLMPLKIFTLQHARLEMNKLARGRSNGIEVIRLKMHVQKTCPNDDRNVMRSYTVVN